ncbi:MAG: hypothetical protein MUF14_00915 [Hyphomonadaceae bacterium]|nr:hypothetical protein [Hyphomonadaceae bacterium]
MNRPSVVLLAALICLAQACGPNNEATEKRAETADQTVTPEDEAAAEAAALAMPQEEVTEGDAASDDAGGASPDEDGASFQMTGTMTVTGTLTSIEVGDNMYVQIKNRDGTELNALCEAEQCQGWMEAGALPASLVGKSVTATVTMGEQVDGGGNTMGAFPAVTAITITQ